MICYFSLNLSPGEVPCAPPSFVASAPIQKQTPCSYTGMTPLSFLDGQARNKVTGSMHTCSCVNMKYMKATSVNMIMTSIKKKPQINNIIFNSRWVKKEFIRVVLTSKTDI